MKNQTVQNDFNFHRLKVFSYMREIQNPYRSESQCRIYAQHINDIYNRLNNDEKSQLLLSMAARFKCLTTDDRIEEYLTYNNFDSDIITRFSALYKSH